MWQSKWSVHDFFVHFTQLTIVNARLLSTLSIFMNYLLFIYQKINPSSKLVFGGGGVKRIVKLNQKWSPFSIDKLSTIWKLLFLPITLCFDTFTLSSHSLTIRTWNVTHRFWSWHTQGFLLLDDWLTSEFSI